MKYDSIIIGAGLSGLAAGIRLAHYGKKVCICEKHSRIGGLNSYYNRKSFFIETGLHAMTNFAPRKGNKALPLMKLLRQLRIPYDKLELREHEYSLVKFPGKLLRFTNKFEDFTDSVADNFPEQVDCFRKLDEEIRNADELNLNSKFQSAKEIVDNFLSDKILRDMIFCPLMYYGSAIEDDMDFSQFVIMYKSIFHEGFCRPAGKGILNILGLLEERFTESGGELKLNTGIKKINTLNCKAVSVETETGEILECEKILSSAGNIETLGLCNELPEDFHSIPRGELAYVETVAVMKDELKDNKRKEAIMFFNDSDSFEYKKPEGAVDLRSGVICFPANFKFEEGDPLPTPAVRVTSLANHNIWEAMDKKEYSENKNKFSSDILKKAEELTGIENIEQRASYIDTITPRTISRYTGHIHGSIYGSPHKVKDGSTHLENLFICGTDQGFLGITGSMLSGISMANLHMLR